MSTPDAAVAAKAEENGEDHKRPREEDTNAPELEVEEGEFRYEPSSPPHNPNCPYYNADADEAEDPCLSDGYLDPPTPTSPPYGEDEKEAAAFAAEAEARRWARKMPKWAK